MIFSKFYKMLSEIFEDDFKKFPDFNSVCTSSPDSSSSDFSGNFSPNWDPNDFLECVKYDEIELEKNPAFFTCVSPVHLAPVSLSTAISGFSTALSGYATTTDASSQQNSTDLSPTIPWETFLPNFNINDFSDEFINDIAKVEFSSSFFDQTINSVLFNKPHSVDYDHSTKTDANPSIDTVRSAFNKPYHLDFDHCYSAPPKPEENDEEVEEEEDEEEKFPTYYWDSSPCSPDSSETSSEEVDVVTVPEELIPIVPKIEITQRIVRKRGRKSVKKAQSPLSARSLKAAMKNSRITNIRRTYRRRKVSNSVETSPSNSVPSSTQSSRCSSDNEDAGKRANHNSSERKRREILRTALQNLRICVPTIQNNPKAPKVLILNSATDYINELINEEQHLKLEIRREDQRRKRNEAELKSLISYFKRHC